MRISIRHLSLPVSLGVHEWEKAAPRTVRFTLDIEYDGMNAARSDSMNDTIDYAQIEQLVAATAQARHYELLESLIAAIAREVLNFYPAVQEIMVEAEKPGALRLAQTVAVSEVFRR